MQYQHRFLIISILLLMYSISALAQSLTDTTRLLLDFPLFDLPYQSYASRTTGSFIAGYANPSMKQSLQTTTNFYSSAHFGLKQAFKNVQSPVLREILTHSAVGIFDLLTATAPLGAGWLHEEYHRAVLTRRKVNSANEMNRFPLGEEAIKVYHLTDEDLERMHDNHQNDWRRLQVAGKEGELHHMQTLQRNNFFYDQNLPHIAFYWFFTFSTGAYVRSSSTDDFNRLVDEMNQKDGTDIRIRDFTGPDYTAWAYSLFRPEQPYRARGIHPSGVGTNRYLKPADMSQAELDFIKKQGNLQWLNFVSPTFLGFSKIRLSHTSKGNSYGNFALRSIILPYGNDIMLDLWYQSPKINAFFVLHSYFNKDNYFPGIEGGLVDYPALGGKLALSPRVMLWMQPEALSFTTEKGQLGGMLGLKTRANLGLFSPYVEIEGKTKGWVMGNVFLEDNVSVNAGLNLFIR